MILLVVAGVALVAALGFTAHELRWIRRIERASGDREALERLLGRRRRTG